MHPRRLSRLQVVPDLQHIPVVLICLVPATVPLIFGAVHPVVSSCYVGFILLCIGGLLLYTMPGILPPWLALKRFWPALLILFYIVLQSIPLPVEWVELVSPARAQRVELVNLHAGSARQYISLSELGVVSMQRAIFAGSVLVYFVGVKLLLHRNSGLMHILAAVIAVVGLLEAMYGLSQFLFPHIGVLWLETKHKAAQGTVIYKNQYAGLLNMCWPFTLAAAVLFLESKPLPLARKRRAGLRHRFRSLAGLDPLVPLALTATGTILLAVLFSLSRGGILTMLLVLLLFGFFLPGQSKVKRIFGCLLVVFIVGYGAALDLNTIVRRFDTIVGSGAGRIGIYLASLPMLLDHWLTGIGMGAYTLLSPVYLKGAPPHIHFSRVHCEYLEVMIELGIPMSLFLFCWTGRVVAGYARRLYKRVREQDSLSAGYRTLYGIAAFCGLVGFLCHGLVDFGWRLPCNLIYAATLAAMLSHALETPQTSGAG